MAAALSPPTPIAIGSGQDTIELDVSEDAYLGDAMFTVLVDGIPIGDALTTTAVQSLGQQQKVFVQGNFGVGPHAVSVDFLNDLYAGTPNTDRNLYVQNVVSGGVITPVQLVFYSAGTQTIPVQVPPQPVTVGTGPDAIVLKIAEDAYQGDAQFTISVDGTQIGGVQTAQATRGSGLDQTFTVLGTFGYGGHSLTVNFLNDLYAGTPATDRNLYVDTITRLTQGNGVDAVLDSGGPVTFNLSTIVPPSGPQTIGAGPTSIEVDISEDGYFAGNEVDARFTISVDGVQVGGVETAAASHALGQTQAFTVQGDFGPGPHTVSVDFLNDAYAGTPSTDRNLYVDSAMYGGLVKPVRLALYSSGVQSFAVLPAPVLTGSNITGPASGNTVLNGTSGDDTIVAHGAGNTINGNGGNDGITGGEAGGDTIVVGTAGDQRYALQDTIAISGDANHVIAGDEAVMLSGQVSNTQATLGNGANTVMLDGAGNTVSVGSGVNVISATGGGATVRASGFQTIQAYSDTVTIGGTGGGTFFLAASSETLTTGGLGNSVTIGAGTFDITPGSGSDSVTVSGFPFVPNGTIRLAGQNNTVTANSSVLTILGGDGHDTFNLSGNYSFGSGSAAVTTGGAFNTFNLIGGSTTADVGSGNDTVVQSGGTSSLAFHGSGNMLFLHDGPPLSSNAGPATSTVNDQSTGLQVYVDPGLKLLELSQFGPGLTIHLLGGAGGYTSADQAFQAATQPAGPGGGLELALGSGVIHFGSGVIGPDTFVMGS